MRIRDDWMRYWLEILPNKLAAVEHFNHTYPLRTAGSGATLEIGCGLGGQLRYEDLSAQRYFAVELRVEMASAIRRDFPAVNVVAADCQERLPYESSSFDRVVAIHVLEHLPNLPAALDEIQRVLKPGGKLGIVIPCESGLLHTLGRKLSTQRIFERRYNTSYDWLVKSEHVNAPAEILAEVRSRFRIEDRRFWPFRVPTIHLNLLIGVTAERMPSADAT